MSLCCNDSKPVQTSFLAVGVSAALFCFVVMGCSKALDVTPPAIYITGSAVFKNDSETLNVVTGVYISMSNSYSGFCSGQTSISMLMGMAADELTNYSVDIQYSLPYTNAFTASTSYFWPELYRYLYACNAVINSSSAPAGSLPALRRQAIGEAKFLRAMMLFYATNLFGAAPMPLTTNYQVNNTLARSPEATIYAQVVGDLKDANGLLTDDYLDPGGRPVTERVRPNRQAAAALLARVYLYMGDWEGAAAEADSVIGHTSLYELVADVQQVFLRDSREAIWQLQPAAAGYNTFDAMIFILTQVPGAVKPAALSSMLLNSFSAEDKRRSSWTGVIRIPVTGVISAAAYYYPYKYKVVGSPEPTLKEYLIVLRLAELYLIRAEARTHLGDVAGAASDVKAIRQRAGLPDTAVSSREALLDVIARERRMELFTEWGHRWFDLKRTGALDALMKVVTPLKGGVWNSYAQLLPVPRSEIQLNPNLTQNSGYQ